LNADLLDGLEASAFLLKNATVALTSDWDIGAHKITANQFASAIATGTAPLTIVSTTKVSNLNSDLLDGLEGAAYANLAGQSGGQTIEGDTASGGNLTLSSTHHGTKGSILFGTSAYDQVNNRLGLGVYPTTKLTIKAPVENAIDSVIRVGTYLDIIQTYFGAGCYIGGNCRLTTSSATTNKFSPVYNAAYGMLMKQDFVGAINWYGINWNSSSAERELSDFILAMYITYNGDLWVAGNCSALSFTDRTPMYEGDALSEIEKIKAKDGKIDHSTLPEFVQSDFTDKDGKVAPGRDIGGMVSVLTVGIQQLKEFYEKAVEDRDKKIADLVDRLEKLETVNAKR
jgi:hypothetical protein